MCEEYNHWAELVFLYVQYDEFDNAALIMIAHSPTAWEHSHFKDVLVKVGHRQKGLLPPSYVSGTCVSGRLYLPHC